MLSPHTELLCVDQSEGRLRHALRTPLHASCSPEYKESPWGWGAWGHICHPVLFGVTSPTWHSSARGVPPGWHLPRDESPLARLGCVASATGFAHSLAALVVVCSAPGRAELICTWVSSTCLWFSAFPLASAHSCAWCLCWGWAPWCCRWCRRDPAALMVC